MNNKGFTLIELLAVIVILAIIALIATPIILGIISDSRKSAIDRTAELIGSEAQLAFNSYMMANNGDADADSYCDYMTTTYFKMDGATLVTTGCDNATKTEVKVQVNGRDYTATYASGTITIAYSGGNDNTKTVTMK